MAFAFPLATSVFADRLRVVSSRWELREFVETSGTGRGEVITAVVAWPRWRAALTLAPARHGEAAQLRALFEAIGAAGKFDLYDHALPWPQADPGGVLLGAATPTISAIGADNHSLRVTGLPAGYVLTAGDALAISYGSSPVRRTRLRVCETVAASGAGMTPAFEVRPPLRPGVYIGQAVTLVKPAARMMLEPGSYDPGEWAAEIAGGASFTAIEAF